MRKIALRKITLLVTLAGLLQGACGGPSEAALDQGGSITIPLITTGEDGKLYRMRAGAWYCVEALALDNHSYCDATRLDQEETTYTISDVPAGSYNVTLRDRDWNGSFSLVRSNPDGSESEIVPAELLTQQPVTVEVTNGQTTVVTFLFQVGTRDVVFDVGSLELGFEVRQSPSREQQIRLVGSFPYPDEAFLAGDEAQTLVDKLKLEPGTPFDYELEVAFDPEAAHACGALSDREVELCIPSVDCRMWTTTGSILDHPQQDLMLELHPCEASVDFVSLPSLTWVRVRVTRLGKPRTSMLRDVLEEHDAYRFTFWAYGSTDANLFDGKTLRLTTIQDPVAVEIHTEFHITGHTEGEDDRRVMSFSSEGPAYMSAP